MSTRRITLAALLVLPLAIAGCKISSINYFPPKAAHVRAVNVVADAPSIDVSIDDTVTWPGLAFAGSTDFVDHDNVSTTFTARLAGVASPLVQAGYSLAGEQTYTLIAYGETSAPSLLLLPDVTIQPGSGRTQVRLINTAPGIGPVDAYITAPGTDITNVVANLVSVDYSNVTVSLQFASGTYQMRLTGAGTKTVVYDSGPINLADNTSSDLIMYSLTSGRLPNLLQLDVNGASQRVVRNNTLANVKFLNAAPQAGNVNVLVDGIALFSDLAYPQPSGYSTLVSGAHTVSFEATVTPGAPIAATTPTLAPATDTTVFVTGLAGSTQAVVLADDNRPPAPGNARLRFVNATSIGVGPVDVLVNNVKQASAIAPDAASAYVQVAPGTLTVAFVDAATGAVLTTRSDITLSASQTQTIFLVGSPNALGEVISPED